MKNKDQRWILKQNPWFKCSFWFLLLVGEGIGQNILSSFFLFFFYSRFVLDLDLGRIRRLCPSHDESRAKNNLTEPIPLQVEHVAVEFIVEPFRSSGPFLRTMKIFAQRCRVDTSYFSHNWETRGGRERLIPSRTSQKDLPTAHSEKGKKTRHRERWEDNIREWTGLAFAKSQRAVVNRKKLS